MMNPYIATLQEEFKSHADPKMAEKMQAYMKDRFAFFGIKTPHRRILQKPFLERNQLPEKTEAFKLVKALWGMPEREYHYFAQELLMCYKKKMEPADIELFEYLVANQSWWDTVDAISVHLIGPYFKKFPKERLPILNQWLNSKNMWLQRASLLYQLKYKQDVDIIWMTHAIEKLIGSKEFFINKAIGWVLREYSRTDADWVKDFVETHPGLSNLSKKEALRLL